MCDPTPGQICYEAFWHDTTPDLRGDPWATLPAPTQRRWEAAAQAVRNLVLHELVTGFAQAREEASREP